jgi:hypothetical protein
VCNAELLAEVYRVHFESRGGVELAATISFDILPEEEREKKEIVPAIACLLAASLPANIHKCLIFDDHKKGETLLASSTQNEVNFSND